MPLHGVSLSGQSHLGTGEGRDGPGPFAPGYVPGYFTVKINTNSHFYIRSHEVFAIVMTDADSIGIAASAVHALKEAAFILTEKASQAQLKEISQRST